MLLFWIACVWLSIVECGVGVDVVSFGRNEKWIVEYDDVVVVVVVVVGVAACFRFASYDCCIRSHFDSVLHLVSFLEDPDAVWDDEEFARRMYAAMNPGPVGYGPLEFDQSTQSAIRHLANALQNHPFLHSLTWGNGPEHVSQAVALALLAALPHNKTIKKLDLSHTPRGFQTTLPELLEGAQHVEELLLPWPTWIPRE